MENIRHHVDKYLVMPLLRRSRVRFSPFTNLVSILLGIAIGTLIAMPVVLRPTEPIDAPTIDIQPIPVETHTTDVAVPDIASSEPVIELEVKTVRTTPVMISCDERELFAKCVEAEASGEGLEGKRLVADVILNRTKSTLFPGTTITEVILQNNPSTGVWQFSVAGNGMLERAVPTQETYEAIDMELKSVSYPGLLYFTSEGYSPYGTPWAKIGNHYFSTAK